MYKEIFIRSLNKGRPYRCTVATAQLHTIVSKKTKSACEIYISQDSWSTAERNQLADYDLWLDIDAVRKSEHSPQENLQATLPVCQAVIRELLSTYAIQEPHVIVYFSGHGGFHLLLPFEKVDGSSSEHIQAVSKLFCAQIEATIPKDLLKAATLDKGLYSTRHLIRAPWTLHRSGLRKVPISIEEAQLTPKRLLTLIEQRSEAFKVPGDWNVLFRKPVNKTFSEKLTRFLLHEVSKEQDGTTDLDICTIQQFTEDAYCMRWFASLPGFQGNIGFNHPKMFLLSMFKMFGIPKGVATEVTRAFAIRFSGQKRSPAEKTHERLSEVDSAANTIYGSRVISQYAMDNGRCSSLLPSATGLKNAVSVYCNGCPNYSVGFQPPTPYRLSVSRLLKKRLSGDALKVFLELSINGQAANKLELERRTDLSSHRLTAVITELQNKDLIELDKQGRNQTISAKRRTHSSIPSKS